MSCELQKVHSGGFRSLCCVGCGRWHHGEVQFGGLMRSSGMQFEIFGEPRGRYAAA